jgi:hypothetical protein
MIAITKNCGAYPINEGMAKPESVCKTEYFDTD